MTREDIQVAIETHGALTIYLAADNTEPGVAALARLGLPTPIRGGDVYRCMRQSEAALTASERRQVNKMTSLALLMTANKPRITDAAERMIMATAAKSVGIASRPS